MERRGGAYPWGQGKGRGIPVSCWCNEVETAVYTPIFQHSTNHTRLPIQIFFILGVNVLNDRVPTVA